MRLSKIVFCIVFTGALVSGSASADLFRDDFEDGSLDNWTIGGRRGGNGYSASVVSRHGSQMGRLYKDGWSEVTLWRDFAYDPDLLFRFDMEVQAIDEAYPYPSSSDYYSRAGVEFGFYDGLNNHLGSCYYWGSTSSYPFSSSARNRIPLGLLTSYSLPVGDLLAEAQVSGATPAKVRLEFEAYGSWTGAGGSPYSWVWVDNVSVVPEPGSLALLALGGLALIRRRRTRPAAQPVPIQRPGSCESEGGGPGDPVLD